MPFVSVTRLRIRSPWYLPPFILHTASSFAQAKRAPGGIAVEAVKDAGLVFWTKSVWQDEASMRAYMLAGAHRKAMPKLAGWCDEAATCHWTQESDRLPTWPDAYEQLIAKGRKSKVKHPSAAHEAFEIPPMRI